MGKPLTVRELQQRCEAWPVERITSAMMTVLTDAGCTRAEAAVLSGAVAVWLKEADSSDPPPLGADAIRRIWEEMTTRPQHRQRRRGAVIAARAPQPHTARI